MRERPSLVSRAARTCRPALAAVVPPHAGPDRGRRGEREAGLPRPIAAPPADFWPRAPFRRASTTRPVGVGLGSGAVPPGVRSASAG